MCFAATSSTHTSIPYSDMDATVVPAITAQEVADDIIVKNLTALQDMLDNMEMFRLDSLEMTIDKGVGTVTIPLRRQYMMESIIEALSTCVNINILYAWRSPDGSRKKTIAYSMPYIDEMFVIALQSQQYGIVEQLHLTFFESLDMMFAWLHACLTTMLEKQHNIIIEQQQPLVELYRCSV